MRLGRTGMRTICLALIVAGEAARAQQPVQLPVTTVRVVETAPMISTSASNIRTTRAFVDDAEVIPGERQVGGELSYFTSAAGLDGRPVRFTDLVVSRLAARASLADRFELGARLELLAKQPFPGGHTPFAGGWLQGRLQLQPRSSIFVGANGAPLAGARGAALEAAAGWSRRVFIDHYERYLAFATTAGAQSTHLLARTAAPPQLAELIAEGALQAIASDGDAGFGLALGTTLAVPVWHTGQAFWVPERPAFDARTRVHFHLQAHLTVGLRWDLFVRWAFLDRGDVAAPATRLPLLQGGHDQTELTFGASYRFGPNVR